MPTTKAPISPSFGSERIELLDILRGFALLGIYIVNIRFMSSSVLYPAEFSWMREGWLNQFTWWILQHFFNEKFFPIFSFLFGVGFGMQMNKMEKKGVFSASFFIRRYLILMLFGLVHVFFIWPGDVLALYGVAGIFLLLIRKLSVKYIIILALVILLFPFYIHLRNYASNMVTEFGWKPLMFLYNFSYHDIVDIKTSGTFFQKVWFRIYEYSVYYRNAEYIPLMLSMIIIGYVAGKKQIYNRIPAFLKSSGKYAVAALIIVIIIHFIYFQNAGTKNFMMSVLLKKSMMISNIMQAFLYLYIISLLYSNGIFVKLLEPLSFAGRMSLTNYMMQSIMAVLIFRGFIDLYGKMDLAALMFVALVVFSLLVLASKFWLSRFRYGPLEWVWRQLSYAEPINFRIHEHSHKINSIEK